MWRGGGGGSGKRKHGDIGNNRQTLTPTSGGKNSTYVLMHKGEQIVQSLSQKLLRRTGFLSSVIKYSMVGLIAMLTEADNDNFNILNLILFVVKYYNKKPQR